MLTICILIAIIAYLIGSINFSVIISKKVAQIIKENVPYVKFYPVILDNRN